MSRAAAIHALLTRYSRVVLPRVGVGGGVGVRGGDLGTAAYHLKVGGSDGLWITRRPADPQPRMQRAIYRGAW